jgi:Arc/MetJ-type ribon-helix-helix transcriptional regulator
MNKIQGRKSDPLKQTTFTLPASVLDKMKDLCEREEIPSMSTIFRAALDQPFTVEMWKKHIGETQGDRRRYYISAPQSLLTKNYQEFRDVAESMPGKLYAYEFYAVKILDFIEKQGECK